MSRDPSIEWEFDPQLRPVVKALVKGMQHPRTNIAAAHFDGPELSRVLELYEALPNAGNRTRQ